VAAYTPPVKTSTVKLAMAIHWHRWNLYTKAFTFKYLGLQRCAYCCCKTK